MVRGVILVGYTDQADALSKTLLIEPRRRRPRRQKLGVQVKDLFFTPGGPHDAAISIEAEGPEPIHKFMASVQSLGNVKMKFIRAFSIEEMCRMI